MLFGVLYPDALRMRDCVRLRARLSVRAGVGVGVGFVGWGWSGRPSACDGMADALRDCSLSLLARIAGFPFSGLNTAVSTACPRSLSPHHGRLLRRRAYCNRLRHSSRLVSLPLFFFNVGAFLQETIFLDAAYNGLVETVNDCLTAGVDVKAVDADGMTALHR